MELKISMIWAGRTDGVSTDDVVLFYPIIAFSKHPSIHPSISYTFFPPPFLAQPGTLRDRFGDSERMKQVGKSIDTVGIV